MGLNFASEQEAEKFHQAVETKVQEKHEKQQRRMSKFSLPALETNHWKGSGSTRLVSQLCDEMSGNKMEYPVT